MSDLKEEITAKLSAAAEEMELPLDVFMEIVNESLPPTKEDMDALGQTVESGNYDDIQTVSHKLKGTFGNLRLDHMAGPAGRINDLSKESTGIEEIKEIYPALKEDFDKFIEAMS